MIGIQAPANAFETQAGHFCWVDLAATDAAKAKDFYGKLFGWTAHDETSLGGSFTRLRSLKGDVGSLYQLNRSLRDAGVPSHWMPYIQVSDIDAAVGRSQALGGEILVEPLVVPGIARIAVILDAVGAQVGLWQPFEASAETHHG